MDLFIDPTLVFDKVASEVALPEDPNAWPDEILQELFKQVPYIADFEPHVVMARVDAEQGFGFGHVEVMNKTEIQRGTSPEAMDAAGIRQARIPVIIKNRKLQPFDIVLTEDSQMLPLTEPRLRQAIFRPQAFDITARTPGDMSMIGQLYPPYRQNYGFGGGGASMSVGMGKQGSADITWSDVAPYLSSEFIGARTKIEMFKQGSSLAAILPTINQDDYNAFFGRLEDPKLQAAFVKNGSAAAASLKTLSEYTPIGTAKTAAVLLETVPASVLQIRRGTDGYSMKTASHYFWMPRERVLDRGELVRELGEKLALDVDMNGSATMTAEPGAGAPPAPTGEVAQTEADRYEMIKDFGTYKVKAQDGRELIGLVFPNLLDVDGSPLPLFLFTNGSQSACQGEIVGVSMGGAASIPEGEPRGRGVFYEVLTNGKAQATIPLTIQAQMSMPAEATDPGTTLHATTFDGRPIQVKVQPNITKVMPGQGCLLVPETMCWLPLDGSQEVVLQSSTESVDVAQKTASMVPFRQVQIRAGGTDSFSFSGMPVEKLAYDQKAFLSTDEAMFLLGGLGVDMDYAVQKLAEAVTVSMPVDVMIGHEITLPEERIREAHKTAAQNLADFPSALARRSLIKEAAAIPDPTAVDTVLSLGFINPENVSTFISYLPTLDEAQKKMCELLVAARLGLKDVPISALEKSIRSTEEVIEGLKVMAFQKN